MEEVLRGVPFVRCYRDNIVITGRDSKEHLENLEEVLKHLQEYGLTVKKEKIYVHSYRTQSHIWAIVLRQLESNLWRTKCQQYRTHHPPLMSYSLEPIWVSLTIMASSQGISPPSFIHLISYSVTMLNENGPRHV